MNGLQFAESLVGHIVTLAVGYAWPVVAIFLLSTQRKAITELIGRIKKVSVSSKGVDLEAEKVDKQLEVTALKLEAAEASPKPVLEHLAAHTVPAIDIASLVETSKHFYLDEKVLAYAESASPADVIDRAWREIEKQLYRLTQQEEPPAFTYLVGNDLFRQAAEENLLDRKLLEAIEGLLGIHNDTVAGIMGWSPTREQATAFVSNAKDVLKLLEPYMQVGYKKKHTQP